MKPVAVINLDSPEEIYVEIIIGTTCNFKCSYCFPGCNDGKYRWPIGEQIEAIHKNLSYMFDVYKEYGKKTFTINISGGEPTLWPELGNFVKYFKENYDARILISSNGSRTLRWWKENAKYFSSINISVHCEEVNVAHTIEVLDWIYLNTDTACRAAVLMDPNNWDKCLNVLEQFKNHEIPWLLKATAVLVNDKMEGFNDEQIEFLETSCKKTPPVEYYQQMKPKKKINNNANKIYTVYDNGTTEIFSANKWYSNNWQSTLGWKCNLGVERFTIWPNGDILGSCGAKNLFNFEKNLNIYSADLPKQFSIEHIVPLTCKILSCGCKSELKLNKEKLIND